MENFRLRITLTGAQPAVWRVGMLPAELTVRELADVFAWMMGWKKLDWGKAHLSRFVFPDGRTIETDGRDDAGNAVRWERTESMHPLDMQGVKVERYQWRNAAENEMRIAELFRDVDEFTYILDPEGEAWQHRVQLEGRCDGDLCPSVYGWTGECPPIGCGGLFAYQRLTAAEQHDLREQSGMPAYDPEEVNEQLQISYHVAELDGKVVRGAVKIEINMTDIHRALEQMREELFAKAPEHFTLRDGLAALEDEKLRDIAERWGLLPHENHDSWHDAAEDANAQEGQEEAKSEEMPAKQEIAEKLEKTILAHLESYLLAAHDEEWEELVNAVNCEDPYYFPLGHELDRFCSEGLLFSTDHMEIQVPEDIIPTVKNYQDDPFFAKRRRRRAWLMDCIETAVGLYGMVTMGMLVRLFNQKAGYHAEEEQIEAEVKEILPIHRLYIPWPGPCLLAFDVKNLDGILLLVKKMQKIDWYIPSVRMIEEEHQRSFYLDDYMAVQPLGERLIRWGRTPSDAGADITHVIYGLRLGSLSHELLQEGISRCCKEALEGRSEKELEAFFTDVRALGDHVRKYTLKGWTPLEIAAGKVPLPLWEQEAKEDASGGAGAKATSDESATAQKPSAGRPRVVPLRSRRE